MLCMQEVVHACQDCACLLCVLCMLASVTNSLHSCLDSPPSCLLLPWLPSLPLPQAAELVVDNIETYCSTLTEVRDHLETLLKVHYVCVQRACCVRACVCVRMCLCMCVCVCIVHVCTQCVSKVCAIIDPSPLHFSLIHYLGDL